MYSSNHEEAYFHYQKSTQFYDEKDYDTAIAHLQQAIDLLPGQAEWHYSLGSIFHLAGRYEEALIPTKTALSLDPTLYEAECLLGDVLFRMERYDDAEKHYLHFIEQPVDDAEILSDGYYSLGRLAYTLHEMDKAFFMLRRAIELYPSHLMAHYYLGRTLRWHREYEEALEELRTCLQLEPHYNRAYYLMGYVYKDMKQIELARQAWEKVLEMDTGEIATYAQRALNSLADLSTANIPQTEPTSLYTQDAQFYYQRGMHYWREECDREQAIENFEKAVELSPAEAEWRYTLGQLLYAVGRDEAALDSLQAALTLDPTMTKAEFMLGKLLAAKGQHDEAEKHFDAVIRQKPDDPIAAGGYYGLGLLAYKAGNWEQAASLLHRSVAIYPYNWLSQFYLGATLMYQKKYDQALMALKISMQIEPRHAQTYFVMGYVYKGLNEMTLACQAWQKVLEIDTGEMAVRARHALERNAT